MSDPATDVALKAMCAAPAASQQGSTSAEIIAFAPRSAAGGPVNPSLRRPGLLVRAARAGQAGWRRERDLLRLLGGDPLPPPGAAVGRLLAEEARLDAARRARAADYMLERHITVLIGLLAELRARSAAGAVQTGCLNGP